MLLLERELTQPDRIVGELLQPGGYLKLRELGLEDCLDGIDAQRVNGYVMYKQGEQASLLYPTDTHGPDVAGRSFHNGRFVQKLRLRAAAVPQVSMRQGTVKRLVSADGEEWREGTVVAGVAYRRSGEDKDRVARASLTVVCDGMYSTLRNGLSTPDIKLPSYFVGLVLSGCRLPVAHQACVVLANPSPILFYPISSTEVRCLVDVPGLKLPSVQTGAMGEHLRSLAEQVPEVLREAYLEAVEKGASRSMQNKLMAAQPLHQAGALLLGDAFNMRHPLTGGGMTVALHDTKLLCDMLSGPLDLADPVLTAKQTYAYYTRRKPWAATINTLANALYKARGAARGRAAMRCSHTHAAQVFCDTGESWSEEMRQACFDYLRLGGIYAQGPISLLSGLNPRPFILVAHFFMVALYGVRPVIERAGSLLRAHAPCPQVGRLLLPVPTPRSIFMGMRLLLGASAIILPIIRAEGLRAVFFPALVPRPRSVRT